MRASHALAYAFEDPDLDERRFRSNVAIEGVEPWEELSWVGQEVCIGELRCRVEAPVVRCLATHANPETGERDRQIMTTLTHAFDQERPTFAVALVPLAAGVIHLGDENQVGLVGTLRRPRRNTGVSPGAFFWRSDRHDSFIS